MPNCQYCDKPLVAIGTARGNGKCSHGDWYTRKYHKKCMKYVNFKTSWSRVNKDIDIPPICCIDYDKKMRTYEWVLNHTTFKDTPPSFDEWLIADSLDLFKYY
jgi:hypothetical protein